MAKQAVDVGFDHDVGEDYQHVVGGGGLALLLVWEEAEGVVYDHETTE